MSVLKKLLFVTLLGAALFSSHARKLLAIASDAIETDAIASPESHGSGGGASCV
jgi:hypothetical protein